jgi:two-component system sensor histidine kinase RegB
LAFDLIHLAGLLFMTGGLANPFSVLMLVPTTVSATMLARQTTYGLIALSMLLVTIIAFTPYPLPWGGVPPKFEPLFMQAIWISLCFTLIFLAVYMARVGREGRLRARALVATQFALEQEQKLAALGALAAAAAHELGTPMGTIMLVAKDLQKSWSGDEATHNDIRLIVDEISRCRDILSELREHKQPGKGQHFVSMPVSAVLHEAAAPHENRGILLEFDIHSTADYDIIRAPEIIHSVRSIVENAVGFAKKRVKISAFTNDDDLFVTIEDDGPGFDPHILRRIGEPYVTTRHPKPGRDGGLGLGLFIAQSLLERLGASLSFKTAPSGGALARIRWPLKAQPSTDVHY